MLKLLFIEDDQQSVRPLIKRFKRKGADIQSEVVDFDKAEEKVRTFLPDIVILDLFQGPSAECNDIGKNAFEFIWNERFCPIIIYSAEPGFFQDERERHPFVKKVQKGRRSVGEIEEIINGLKQHVEALSCTESSIRRSVAHALRSVAPYAFDVFSDNLQRNEAVLRCSRRRLAAIMDELSGEDQKMTSWEQYIYPPINEDLRLGDVLQESGASADDPNSFRVVLTPSCDLVSSGERKPKVAFVLAAKCCSLEAGLQLINRQLSASKKSKAWLMDMLLNPGHFQQIIVFPEFKGRIPHMAANLKDLELIPFEEIKPEGKKYLQIASIDSPFREVISWAYLQIACRPGLPERDCESWFNEIVARNG